MKRLGYLPALILLSLAIVGSAVADTLELKDGRVLNGTYAGGTRYDVRFVIDGQEQLYPIGDVAAISFGTTAPSASNSAPSGAQPASSSAKPATPAAPGAAQASASNSVTQSATSTEPAVSSPQPATQGATEEKASTVQQRSSTSPAGSAQSASPQQEPTTSSGPVLVPRPAAQKAAATPQPQPGQMVEVPAGTNLVVRMIDGLDSSKNQVGDRFRASLAQDLIVNGAVVAPDGTDVFGRLADDKEASKFTGKGELKIELTDISINNQSFPITTSNYSVVGKSRTKNTAEKVGGGAALGAIIGAIAGGGKGAAIGAGIGGAGGAGVQAIGKGETVVLPAETMLSVELQQAVKLPVARSAAQ